MANELQQLLQEAKPEHAHAQAILNTALMARDAYANEEANKFYVYTTIALNLVSPVMLVEARQRIDADHQLLLKEIVAINGRDLHQASKDKLILEHKFAFAERHLHAIFSAMSRTDLINPRAEGEINLTRRDLDEWAAIVQGRRTKLPEQQEKT